MLISFNMDQMVGNVPFLDGDYPDFTNRWFIEISSFFITPMLANMTISLIEFTGAYSFLHLMKWHDRFYS